MSKHGIMNLCLPKILFSAVIQIQLESPIGFLFRKPEQN